MPVSMETSFPISISCPLLWLFSGRAMAHLYECTEGGYSVLGPALQLPRAPQDPGSSALGLVGPSHTLPPVLSSCGPARSDARALSAALPIHVLLNHLKKMRPAPGRVC